MVAKKVRREIRTCRDCEKHDGCKIPFSGAFSVFKDKIKLKKDRKRSSDAIFKIIGTYCKDYKEKTGKE